MLFNSIDFAAFLPIVFAIYWLIGRNRIKMQNAFILLSSYIFYGWWDYRFLSLIVVSSILDFLVGKGLGYYEEKSTRKKLLWLSILFNIGLLGFFKYYHFFIDSFIEGFSLLGKEFSPGSLSIILPIGISFYTFQTLSYTIDVYRGKLKPTSDPIAFFTYVAFFPQLVAGPIERARNLLPQFLSKRTFNYELAKDGARQILWGLFKKVVIADSCSVYVDYIFEHHETLNSSSLFLGIFYFTIQIYCDFSGYSDIAIGLGKLFGFRLMKNFDYPFFSRNLDEFWRRWHISLNSWFVEYLYIPLGGNRNGKWKRIRNVLILFTVSGFWHGANWTFVIWGFLFGLIFLLYPVIDNKKIDHNNVVASGRLFPNFRETISMVLVFSIFMFSALLFRAKDIYETISYSRGLFSFNFHPIDLGRMDIIHWVLILIIWEWFFREKEHGLRIDGLHQFLRWLLYLVLIWLVLYFFTESREYIYFQF